MAMSRCHAKRVPLMSLVPSWLGRGGRGGRGKEGRTAGGGRLRWQGRVLARCERQIGGGLVWREHGKVEDWVEEGIRLKRSKGA